jgi:hypothetical protein
MKEKKIREKLGLANLEFALSQVSLDESKASSATSASTTFSLMKAAVARAKVEIKNRDETIMELDDKILELQTSAEILTKYVPPKESPRTEIRSKNHRLRSVQIIAPQERCVCNSVTSPASVSVSLLAGRERGITQ